MWGLFPWLKHLGFFLINFFKKPKKIKIKRKVSAFMGLLGCGLFLRIINTTKTGHRERNSERLKKKKKKKKIKKKVVFLGD